MSHLQHSLALLCVVSILLTACAAPSLPFGMGSNPTPTARPTPKLTATPIELNATVRLEQSGVSLRYPASWYTRELSNTITIAATSEALDAAGPGDDLVVLIESTPLNTLVTHYGIEEVSTSAGLFRVSSLSLQQAGYSIGVTETITVDNTPGLAADLEAAGGAGELIVLPLPERVVRVVGGAAPNAWKEQRKVFDQIVESMQFFTPPEPPTPTPPDQSIQPLRTTNGPPDFVLRLGSNQGPLEGRFVSARGLDVAPDGTLYVAESSQGMWVFGPDGTLIRTFGKNELLDAYDVARGLDGNLFVADYGRNAIARFTPEGTLVQRWGETGNEPYQFGLLSPQRLAIGPDGSIYALDSRVGADSTSAVSSIVRFNPDGSFIERIALPPGSAPNDLAVDQSGNIYLAETFSKAVTKVDGQGQPLMRLGEEVDPQGITAGAVDLDDRGNIYVATWSQGILRFAPDGALLARAGEIATTGTIPTPGQFSLPNGIAVAPNDVVWVSDNDGEYSAVTALRIPTDTEGPAAAEITTTTEGNESTPIPESGLLRQWANRAKASSAYEGYEAEGATGPPDVTECRDSTDAWASETPDGLDTLEVKFEKPVFASQVNIYQNHQPGFITQVDLLDEEKKYTTVYTGTAALQPTCPYVLEVKFTPTRFRIVGVKLTVDQRGGANWNEIDAVELVGIE